MESDLNSEGLMTTDSKNSVVKRGRPKLPKHKQRNVAIYIMKMTRNRLDKIDKNPDRAISILLSKVVHLEKKISQIPEKNDR